MLRVIVKYWKTKPANATITAIIIGKIKYNPIINVSKDNNVPPQFLLTYLTILANRIKGTALIE
jgi:hypothetical protein